MKKIFALFCALAAFAVTASAEEEITVLINGSRVAFDQPPIIVHDRTMVPMRAVFEKLNLMVQWFGEEQRITAVDDNINITMFIDEPYIYVNGEGRRIDAAPFIVNDRTLVPLRAISESVGGQVEWDSASRTVTIEIEEESAPDNISDKTQSDNISDKEPQTPPSDNISDKKTDETADEKSDEALEKKVLELVNAERAVYGIKPLVWNDKLAKVAREHSRDMIERGFFSHENPDGKSPFDRLRDANIRYTCAAENIAAGQSSPEMAVEEWMNSEGHKMNILNPSLTALGVGMARGGDYGIYWTQNFADIK